ncbi:bifunctional Armadillo-like helical/Armadillo-type fold/Importin-beta [Babesia duncani]|uniref:Bifunctional Armadillo-like helical/Armadillo-type fold/Importin-beta n=1 Tax=Babesia duncani TaxID=323732 RepID=A0AAD9UPH0_9APIC|nr:bifunctional Armadillo-like helical/Armadillo-type fold/Importin-beta [Babesia duncani]
MDGSLLTLLEASLDHTSPLFNEAQRRLEQAKEEQSPDFIRALSDVIVSQQSSYNARHLAGILIKNAFKPDSKKNDDQQVKLMSKMTAETLNYIKLQMLTVMKTGNVTEAVLAACAVVSRIAEIELAKKSWPEFFDIIMGMIESNEVIACRSSFTCLNYLVEDLANSFEDTGVIILSKPECDRILTAVIRGVFKDDVVSKRMALRCLQNLLMLVESNMQVESERRIIVEAICRCCDESMDPDVRTAAYDCLVQLVSEYYDIISSSLAVIVPFLWLAIDSGQGRFAIPAFEFWNTICETEIQMEHDPNAKNQRLIPQVIPFLLPKILHTMTLHEFEDMDTDTWTLPMAAGLCLSLCAQCVKNDIVPLVVEFVMQNFQSPHWNRREAAVLAYGYIMEGPDSDTLKMMVYESFDNLCNVLRDTSVAVQDTAAWTIGRIASFHTDVILSHLGSLDEPESNLSKILAALFLPARVAVNVCWIFHELAENLSSSERGILILDAIFPRVCDALVSRTRAPDVNQRNLFCSAYSALCSLCANVSVACKPQLFSMLEHFVSMLASLVAEDLYSLEARTQQDTICGVIQILLTRLDVAPNAQGLWQILVEILSVELSEDALLTVSALINIAGASEFTRHLPKLCEITIAGLQRPELTGSCKIAVELTSDIARVMEGLIVPHINPIMDLLIRNLADDTGPRQLKPPIVTALGDVAMAIGGHYAPYIDRTLALLFQAIAPRFESGPVDDDEWIMYINDLREGVLCAFTGIVYGLKEGGRLDALRNYVTCILGHVQDIVETKPEYFSATNYRLAVALVGDLVNAFGAELSAHLRNTPILTAINDRLTQMEKSMDPSFAECQEKVMWLAHTMRT